MTKLLTHSPDLNKLFEEGYEIHVVNDSHILIHSVPYLTPSRELAYGTLVCKIDSVAGDILQPPSEHTIFFAGSQPSGTDGSVLTNMNVSQSHQEILPNVWIDFTFSAMPTNPYPDYHRKIKTYIKKLNEPLVEIGIEATARTFGPSSSTNNSPFNFPDNNSARAGMTAINNKVAKQKIAIVGVGGTGSYILDFIAKTPVSEIHIYDGDVLLSHNSFRAPGSPTMEELRQVQNKARHHGEIYSRMHKGIKVHPYFIDDSNLNELSSFDFIFLCIDGGSIKPRVVNHLIDNSIPFLDTGLNMRVNDSRLHGQLRSTLVNPNEANLLSEYILASPQNPEREIYESNAQISELNALNAVFAVIAWKRHNSIYEKLGHPDHIVYNLRTNRLVAYEN